MGNVCAREHAFGMRPNGRRCVSYYIYMLYLMHIRTGCSRTLERILYLIKNKPLRQASTKYRVHGDEDERKKYVAHDCYSAGVCIDVYYNKGKPFVRLRAHIYYLYIIIYPVKKTNVYVLIYYNETGRGDLFVCSPPRIP